MTKNMENDASRPRRQRKRRSRNPDVCVEVRVVSEDARPTRAAPKPQEPSEIQSTELETPSPRLPVTEERLIARAGELDRREAELEAAFGLREDRIEQREAELADLQARLERKEQELTAYVSQLQSRLVSS